MACTLDKGVTKSAVPIGFTVFDASLGKQVTWNSAVWKDGAGATAEILLNQ